MPVPPPRAPGPRDVAPGARDVAPEPRGVDVLWCGALTSTQDEARARVREGRRPPFAVATEDQRAGRGRLARTWTTPPGRGLALTYVHPPLAPPAKRSWYPLVAALAARDTVVEMLGELADEPVIGCKWPNDLLDGQGRKLAGILLELSPGGQLLVGIGMNRRGRVTDADGSPLTGAVTLEMLGGSAPSAQDLARLLAARVRAELELLDDTGGDGVGSGQADRYRESCITIRTRVRIEGVARAIADPRAVTAPSIGPPAREGRPVGGPALRGPDLGRPELRGPTLEGWAVDVDSAGRLLVRTDDGRTRAVDVGDVQHLRPAPDAPARGRSTGSGRAEEGAGWNGTARS